MDTRGVSKGIASYYGFVGLDRHPHQCRYKIAGLHDLGGIDTCFIAQVFMAFEGHYNFLERGVTGPFTDTVHGDLYLTGAVQDTCHGVGCSHTKVIVAVGRNNGLVDVGYIVDQVGNLCSVILSQTVTSGIRNIDNSCTCIDNCFDYTGQVFIVRTTCVFCIKLNIINKLPGIFDCFNSPFDYLFMV